MWRRDAPSEADTSDDGSRGSSSCNSSAPSSPPLRRPGKERKGCVAVLLVLSSSSADAEAGLVRRLREATARVLAKKHGRDAAAKLLGRLVLRSRARLGLAELRAILSESLKHADRCMQTRLLQRRRGALLAELVLAEAQADEEADEADEAAEAAAEEEVGGEAA
ncbi:hypothetical protein EMIHUDRAFT_121526, partial [Emiliania huxleyi CCMP1516]